MKENDGLLPDDIKRAREILSDWCSNDGKKFRMCVPVQPDDSDEIMSRVIDAAEASRPVDAALKSPPEIEGLDEAIDGVAEYQQLRQRCGFTKKITQHISVVLEAARRYAALPHCPDGFVCVPRVPNQKMCQAGYETLGWKDGSCMYEHIWNAMIAAAEGK